jgi:hypothetical protein
MNNDASNPVALLDTPVWHFDLLSLLVAGNLFPNHRPPVCMVVSFYALCLSPMASRINFDNCIDMAEFALLQCNSLTIEQCKVMREMITWCEEKKPYGR